MDKLLKALGMFVLAIAITIYQLFVFTKVWLYVAVPLGAPPIGLVTAWGIDLLVGIFMRGTYSIKKSSEDKVKSEDVISPIFSKAVSLTFAWLFAYWFFA